MTTTKSTKAQWRLRPDRPFSENAAHVAGILNKSFMTDEPSPRIEIAEADDWARSFFEDMRDYFGLEVLIRERDRKPSNPRSRKTCEAIITDPRSIARLLRACYEWLDNKALVGDMLVACGDFLSDA